MTAAFIILICVPIIVFISILFKFFGPIAGVALYSELRKDRADDNQNSDHQKRMALSRKLNSVLSVVVMILFALVVIVEVV